HEEECAAGGGATRQGTVGASLFGRMIVGSPEGDMQPEQRDRVVQETLEKYTRYVNAGLAKLYRFANVMTVEWEASGAIIHDLHGKEYIDCSGGPAIFNVGHRPPKGVAAVSEHLDGTA